MRYWQWLSSEPERVRQQDRPARIVSRVHGRYTAGTSGGLASHLHDLACHRRHLSQVPADGPGPWLSPPASWAAHRARHHQPAARRIGADTVTALLQLAGELPPTVVADLLGLRPKTAIA
jgi:hypothetical protein